jgi:hypothetical protein
MESKIDIDKTFEKSIDIFCSSKKWLSSIIADINNTALYFLKEMPEKNHLLVDHIKEVIIQSSSEIMDEIKENNKKIYIIERDILFKFKYNLKLTFICELKYPGWIYSTYNIILKIVVQEIK